jgi:hypothetical protein
MKKGTKIVIGVVITILLLIVMAIGLVVGGFLGLVVIFDQGFKKGRQMKAQAEFDGREFGKTTDQNGCLEKGFSFEPPKHYFANMNINTFVFECLKSSRSIPNFCDGVPTYEDTSEVRDKWRAKQKVEKCPQHPNDEPCLQTIYGKQSYCSYGTGLKKTNENTNRQKEKVSDSNTSSTLRLEKKLMIGWVQGLKLVNTGKLHVNFRQVFISRNFLII